MTIRSEVLRQGASFIHAFCNTCPTEGKYKGQGKHLPEAVFHNGYGDEAQAVSDWQRAAVWVVAEEHDQDFNHDIVVREGQA